MRFIAQYHRQIFLFLILMFALAECAMAFQVCWEAPTRTVSTEEHPAGLPLTGNNALAYHTVYAALEEGFSGYTRSWMIPQISDGCTNIRVAEGIYLVAMTATNVQGEQSGYSRQVRKTEGRLGGPSGGSVLRGPQNGTVITE